MPKDNTVHELGKYTTIAFLLPACVLVGFGMGYGLDKLFGTGFLRIIFLLLGVAAGSLR